MSTAMEPVTVLRAPSVRGEPIRVGQRREAAHDGASMEVAAEQPTTGFQEGFAAGFAEGRVKGYAQGHREGFPAGRAEGIAEAADRMNSELEQAKKDVRTAAAREREDLAAIAATLSNARSALVEGAEDALACLALELACKVLGPALVSVEGVREQVRMLVAGARLPVAVHVSPAVAVELGLLPARDGVRWIADEDVPTGGAVIEGETECIDARLETVLDNFKALLVECRPLPANGCAQPEGVAA